MNPVSTARRLHHYTHDEYAGALELSNLKLEFWAGEIYAMAGGTPEHNALASKVMALLDARLPAGCRTFNSDMLVRISASDVTVFGDGQVVCGKIERSLIGKKVAILNPGLVVEVTSPSTEACDRGEKLDQYKSIKSLRAVWLVSHREPRVTVVERQKRTWRKTDYRSGALVTLATPALTVDVDAIYRALDGL